MKDVEKYQQVLIEASKEGKNNLVVIALKKGAKVDQPDESGKNALYYAARYNHFNTVKILLEKGAKAELPCIVKHYSGAQEVHISALYIACLLEHYDIVDILLDNITNAQNIHPPGAVTPIHILASQGQICKIESLLTKGVDINGKDAEGMTPLERAKDAKQRYAVEFLQSNPINKIMARDNENYNPLRYEEKAIITKQNKTIDSILTDEEFIRITGIDDFFKVMGHE